MNHAYAKLVNDELTYAPDMIVTANGTVIVNPKRLSYLQAGYKPLDVAPPAEDPPPDHTWAISSYRETHDAIVAVYKPVPIVKPPRTFSKLKLVAALTELGLWQSIRDWLTESGYYDLFVAAQSFREDHPSFNKVLAALKSRFALTDADVEALLSQCLSD